MSRSKGRGGSGSAGATERKGSTHEGIRGRAASKWSLTAEGKTELDIALEFDRK